MQNKDSHSKSWPVTCIDVYHAYHHACGERLGVADHANGERRFYAKGRAEQQRFCPRCKTPLNTNTPLRNIDRPVQRIPDKAAPAPVSRTQNHEIEQRPIQGTLGL